MGITERKEREKEQRRNDIINAAEQVFFSKGMETATMDDVANEAELSKGTLYLYFKSKEDLYLAINQRGLVIMCDLFKKAMDSQKKGMEKIMAIGEAYAEFSKKYNDYYNALVYYDSHHFDYIEEDDCAFACHQQGQRTIEIVAEAIHIGVKDGSINKKINPMETAIVLWGQTTGMIQIMQTKGDHFKESHNIDIDLDKLMALSFEMIKCSLKP